MNDLSPLAAAFGQMWMILRDDTEHTLVGLFRCDPGLVEDAAVEWFEAQRERDLRLAAARPDAAVVGGRGVERGCAPRCSPRSRWRSWPR